MARHAPETNPGSIARPSPLRPSHRSTASPAPLLALLGPALLATELALVPIAITGGWLGHKLLAWSDTLRTLPRLLRERREIQAGRAVGAGRFADALTADLDSPYLGRVGRCRVLRAGLRVYWSAVLGLLGAGSSRSATPG